MFCSESLNRRTEYIETMSFGSVHARCVGEVDAPLILYVHGRADDPTKNKKAGTQGQRGANRVCGWFRLPARAGGLHLAK